MKNNPMERMSVNPSDAKKEKEIEQGVDDCKHEKSEQNEQNEFRAFRVHGGEKIGSHDKIPEVGDVIENRYGTRSEWAVNNIVAHNDEWAAIMRGDYRDDYQKILIIKVNKWHIPKPDVTHDEKTDHEQIFIEKGVVKEVLSVNEFIRRYLNKLPKK